MKGNMNLSRMLGKIVVDEATGCHLYTGYKNNAGYGKYAGKYVHRIVKSIDDGIDLPDSRIACLHDCDNPPCCNPEHLFWGTQQDNIKDMNDKGRHGRPSRSKLSESDITEIVELRNSGWTYQAIADKFKITRPHAWGIVKEINHFG